MPKASIGVSRAQRAIARAALLALVPLAAFAQGGSAFPVAAGSVLHFTAPQQSGPRPAGDAPAPRVLRLTLRRAVEIAEQPEGNARLQIAGEQIRQAQARSGQARAALLPDFSFAVTEQNQTRNLAALGIRFQLPLPGFQFPRFVGPFTVFDARGSVTQNVFDFGSIRRFQASRAAVRASRAEGDSTRDQVTSQVAHAYLNAMRAEASLEAAKANVDLSEALRKLAENQKAAGTGIGIEVTRARVQLANDRQHLIVAENDRRRAHLELLKLLSLELDTELELSDKLAFLPAPVSGLREAVAAALELRPEWKAQQRREESARLSHSAVAMERLPSLVGFADYGSIGASIHDAIPTRTYGLSLRLPVFDGGRRDARRAEAASQVRQERVRTRDLREQIELEVRVALDALASAEQQVKAAQEGLQLAESELEHARDRYRAGVTTSVEVTDAQTRLARARENQINALFNYNLARVDFGAATGTIRQMLP